MYVFDLVMSSGQLLLEVCKSVDHDLDGTCSPHKSPNLSCSRVVLLSPDCD